MVAKATPSPRRWVPGLISQAWEAPPKHQDSVQLRRGLWSKHLQTVGHCWPQTNPGTSSSSLPGPVPQDGPRGAAGRRGKQRQRAVRTASAGAKKGSGPGRRQERWPAGQRASQMCVLIPAPSGSVHSQPTKGAGKGKPGSIGGSSTSSTSGKRPCIRGWRLQAAG